MFCDHCGITNRDYYFLTAPLFEGIVNNLCIIVLEQSIPWKFKHEIALKRKQKKWKTNGKSKQDHHEITRDHHGSSFFSYVFQSFHKPLCLSCIRGIACLLKNGCTLNKGRSYGMSIFFSIFTLSLYYLYYICVIYVMVLNPCKVREIL